MSTKNNLLSDQLIYNGESQTPTHLHLLTYNQDNVEETSADKFETIKNKIQPGAINWLQVHGLNNTETVRRVCEHFEIDFLVLQDILNANHPTKVEEHEQYNVIILKLFDYNGIEELGQQQLCIIQGKEFVLTFLERETDFFDNVTQAIVGNVIKIRTRQSDYLLSVLLNNVMSNYISLITTIDDALEDLEEELLTITYKNDIGMLIQVRRRQYMDLKRAILPLKEQYAKLLRAENDLVHKINRPYFNDVNDHLQFVLQTIDICRETLSALVDLYISNNDLRMNDIMKRLTVVSTIFIPLTFLVGVWGMNFRFMPELDWKYGYIYAWSVMFVITVIVYWFFKKKKWY